MGAALGAIVAAKAAPTDIHNNEITHLVIETRENLWVDENEIMRWHYDRYTIKRIHELTLLFTTRIT